MLFKLSLSLFLLSCTGMDFMLFIGKIPMIPVPVVHVSLLFLLVPSLKFPSSSFPSFYVVLFYCIPEYPATVHIPPQHKYCDHCHHTQNGCAINCQMLLSFVQFHEFYPICFCQVPYQPRPHSIFSPASHTEVFKHRYNYNPGL